jgi:hypothetical protein
LVGPIQTRHSPDGMQEKIADVAPFCQTYRRNPTRYLETIP